MLDAVHGGDARPHEREQACAVEPTPAGLRHVEELVRRQEALVREPAPFVTRWRSRIPVDLHGFRPLDPAED